MDLMSIGLPVKFEVRSFARSRDNSDWSFGWGCEPQILRKRRLQG